MEKVCQMLKEANVFYLATVDGDQPRVRPFGCAHIFEGKLYIHTGRNKAVSRQMAANPKVEICAFHQGKTLRITAEAVDDPRIEAQASLLDAYPYMKKMYAAGDGNNQVLYLKNATATISVGPAGEGETITF